MTTRTARARAKSYGKGKCNGRSRYPCRGMTERKARATAKTGSSAALGMTASLLLHLCCCISAAGYLLLYFG
jgi:hypothetical protein